MISSVLIFILVLSILVIVHELGHFIMAKRSGIWVEEFGFGLPPRLIGKKIGETLYSINALPFGGFVKLHGENTDDRITDNKRAFLNKSKKVRVSIILAGVIMNFLLGIFAFGIVYSFLGIPKTTENVKVVEVRDGSPAKTAGIMVNDVVRKVGDISVRSNDEFINNVEKYKGTTVNIQIQRPNVEGLITLSAEPRIDPPSGEGSLGVVISSTETYFAPIWQRPFYGIYYGFQDALFWGKLVAGGMFDMVAGLFRGVVPKDVAGPVGIYALTSQAAKFGIFSLINFLGVLSINLAILNVIPFPALDGGRLLFIMIEAVFGKRVVPRVEAAIHTVGIIVLLTLILAITAHDIQKIIVNGGVKGYLDSVLK